MDSPSVVNPTCFNCLIKTVWFIRLSSTIKTWGLGPVIPLCVFLFFIVGRGRLLGPLSTLLPLCDLSWIRVWVFEVRVSMKNRKVEPLPCSDATSIRPPTVLLACTSKTIDCDIAYWVLWFLVVSADDVFNVERRLTSANEQTQSRPSKDSMCLGYSISPIHEVSWNDSRETCENLWNNISNSFGVNPGPVSVTATYR